MSGFVALFNLDGAPVDAALLERMTTFLSFRGPDQQHARVLGAAGFGHALLRLGDSRLDVAQPMCVGGGTWIVGDARLDGRDELLALLAAEAAPLAANASDIALIGSAYRTWGEAGIARLLGDFAFVIWDAARRRVFCGRDHLGIKPLYYYELGATLAISNTLDCLRLHPGVSAALNESAIADFLLFGENRDAATTMFQSIRRVPPAHWCTWDGHGRSSREYWKLPVDETIHFRHNSDYVDRFNELLRHAVADRLRSRRVTILMSGGLDSTALAATAASMRSAATPAVDAVTSVYERLVPDPERPYASRVASHLDIPIRYDVRDDEIALRDWSRVAVATPEPVVNPMAFAAGVRFLQTTASGARVFFYGEGPDNALRYEWRPYLAHLIESGRFARVLRALADDVVMHPRLPLRSSVIQLLAARRTAERRREEFPDWINPSFAERAGCRDRWAAAQRSGDVVHRIRPAAYASLDAVRWQSIFEDCDITGGRGCVEFRHPFLDIRLLRYLLALPAMPWCRNKLIIRRAMNGVLPNVVLMRKKTAVGASADFHRVTRDGLPPVVHSRALGEFIEAAKVPRRVSREQEMRTALRPLGLAYWLRHSVAAESREFVYGTESAAAV